MYSDHSDSEEELPLKLPSPYDKWNNQITKLSEMVEFHREYDGLEWCKFFYIEDILYNACLRPIMSHDELCERLKQVVSSSEWEELSWTEDLFFDDHSLQNLYRICYFAAGIMDIYQEEHNILTIMFYTLMKRQRIYCFEPHMKWSSFNPNWFVRKI